MAHVVELLIALIAYEVWGWLPRLISALVDSAVRRLPESERARWAEEWERHALDLSERRLYAVCWAFELRFREAGKLRVALGSAQRASVPPLDRDLVIHRAAMTLLPLSLLVGLIALWAHAFSAIDIAGFGIMYMACGIGVAVGYHRLLSHNSFASYPWVRCMFAVLGSMAAQGSVIQWVANERRHHIYADREGDPHSPLVGGLRLKSLWHAHTGWRWQRTDRRALAARYASDLLNEPGIARVDRAYPWLVLTGILLPSLMGFLSTGTIRGAALGALWAGGLRIFVQSNVIRCTDSLCHVFGRRPHQTEDNSTNLAWLALPSFGESWHNNHHAFPWSAYVGVRPWQIDPAAMVIRCMLYIGLAWNATTVAGRPTPQPSATM